MRHRLIRQLRAAVLPLLGRLPEGTDVVVRALPAARDASFATLTADLDHALRHDLEPAQDTSPADQSGKWPIRTESITQEPIPGTPAAHTGTPAGETGTPRRGLGLALFLLGTPLRWTLLGVVWAYRRVISPVLPPTCRYHPSCSAYTLQALQVHGVVKGVALSVWRIARCNPFTKGGLDPVPERGAWQPPIHPEGTPRHPARLDPDRAGGPTRAVGLADHPGTHLEACTPKA